MQFNKSIVATTLLSIFALSGCNSGGSDTSTSTPKTTITSLPNLQMCLDTNNNSQCDAKEPSTTTNKDGMGQLVITAQDKNKTILVKTDKQTLSAPATSTVVTPLTTLVVNEMKANKDMTVAEAQAAIKEKLTDFTNQYPKVDIFGDPTQNTVLEKMTNALKDTSAHYNDVDLAELANNAMHASKDEVPVINETGKSDLQEQPQITQDAKEIKPQTLNIEDQIQPIDLTTLFTLNGDSSALHYHVEGMPQGLTQKDNTIEGAITLAGTFSIKVVADNNGALSQPVTLTFEVTAPNTAPTVNDAGQKELQELTNQLNLTQGYSIGDDVTFYVSNLFSDVDNDKLTVTAQFKATGTNASNGITVTQNGDELILSGTPIKKGEMTVTLSANDGVNAQSAEAIITMKIAEGIKPEGNQTQVILGQHTNIDILMIDDEQENEIFSELPINNGVLTYPLKKNISGKYIGHGVNETESYGDNFTAYKVEIIIKNGVIQGPIDFSNAEPVQINYSSDDDSSTSCNDNQQCTASVELGSHTDITSLVIAANMDSEEALTEGDITNNQITYSKFGHFTGQYIAFGAANDNPDGSFMGYITPVTIKNGVIQGVIDFSHSKGEMITD
ncbi:hypothetical protein [Photobacterium leiognathi]|uniref:hypothetical protein n=1 Tax=Photobacterium leiognathi TaxID=553611 RepID=UPI002981F275|nr:hypothetical protein [Photobacterium leiognathi]